jgi:hypothetical protein
MSPEKDRLYLEEATRLSQLGREEQKKVLALHQSVADNPKVPKDARREARERIAALERHLQCLRRARRKPLKIS